MHSYLRMDLVGFPGPFDDDKEAAFVVELPDGSHIRVTLTMKDYMDHVLPQVEEAGDKEVAERANDGTKEPLNLADELRATPIPTIPDSVKEAFKKVLRANAIHRVVRFPAATLYDMTTEISRENQVTPKTAVEALRRWLRSEGLVITMCRRSPCEGAPLMDDGFTASW